MAASQKDRPGLTEWLGGSEAVWPSIDSLDDGEAMTACFYLADVSELRTRKDKPYLKLRLCDRHGEVDGRVWDDADSVTSRVSEGEFVGVRGRVQLYKGTRQLKVEDIRPVQVPPEKRDLFMPRSGREQDRMEAELDQWINSLGDVPLRQLLSELLGPETETGRRFRYAPAAMRNHHAYLGGLLEHTLSIVGICDLLANHYGDALDRDLLIAGALVHDLGKVREITPEAGFPYTNEGKLLGHIVIGIGMIEGAAGRVPALGRDRLLLLLHLVASHQGRYEWQSPSEPRTLEALLLHYADDMDAKVNQAMARIDEVEEGWTAYDRNFRRDFLRHLPGESAAAGESAESSSPGPSAADEKSDDAPPVIAGGDAIGRDNGSEMDLFETREDSE